MSALPSSRNQSIDLHSKSLDWFLYENNTGTVVFCFTDYLYGQTVMLLLLLLLFLVWLFIVILLFFMNTIMNSLNLEEDFEEELLD